VDDLGYALGVVQFGGTPPAAKPWKGEGPGVFELVEELAAARIKARYGPDLSEREPPPAARGALDRPRNDGAGLRLGPGDPGVLRFVWGARPARNARQRGDGDERAGCGLALRPPALPAVGIGG
jgi:hypothetical protein